jgi:hypothetical protein
MATVADLGEETTPLHGENLGWGVVKGGRQV